MRVTIEKLAPTGEGIAKTPEGIGFIAGALPGEEVEAEVEEQKKNFWKGRAIEILTSSPQRVTGPHASCAGCDWAYFERAAALEAKRALFRETMRRIGGLEPAVFGALPAAPSPPRYRLRNRFHVSGRGAGVAIGYFAPRTHRVEPIADCEAISSETVGLLARVREAIAQSGARVTAIAMVETPDRARRIARAAVEPGGDAAAARLAAGLSALFDGVCLEEKGRSLTRTGAARVTMTVGGRPFPVSTATFFQANRHLVGRLSNDVRDLARGDSPGRALDAFGGAGLFAGALLEAGHCVTTVEGSQAAVRDAQSARRLWPDGKRWSIVRSAVAPFLAAERVRFDHAVIDPPRAGLPAGLAALFCERVAHRIIYVSCEPTTLARDLRAILERGFRIASAALYDLIAGTHRIEAVVALDRDERS